MESDDREEGDLQRDIRRAEEALQNLVTDARKELNHLTDEQFEQLKLNAEFQAEMHIEQAKQIYDLLESEDSGVRHSAILQLFSHINERERFLFGKVAGQGERFHRILGNLVPVFEFLEGQVVGLHAEVKALKSQLPARAKQRKKAVSRKKVKKVLHHKRALTA